MLAELDVSDLLSAPTAAERLDHLHAQGLADETGLSWLLDRVDELQHDDPNAADELAELAAAAADARGLLAVRARAIYQRARLLTDHGRLDAALDMVGQARALWLEAGEVLPALRSDLGRMWVLSDLGRHTEAVTVGEDLIVALDAWPDPTDAAVRSMRAHALNNSATAYGYVGEHERALEAYAAAEVAYADLGMSETTAWTSANRAVELLALGRPREALVDLQIAGQRFLAVGDRLFAAQTQGDMALAHQQLGELMTSLNLLEEARRTLDEIGATAESDRLQLALAETYLAVGLLAEARAEAELAGEKTAAAGMPHDTARAHFVMASVDLARLEPGRADEQLQLAARLFAEVGDQQYLARTQLGRAEVAALGGRLDEARGLAGQASVALRDGGWLIALTWAQLRQADWSPTIEAAQRHLDEAEALIGELRLPQLDYHWRLRAAGWARRQGDSRRADDLLTRAVEQIDLASAALPDHALRTAFRTDKFAAHDLLVDLLVDRNEPGDVVRACAIADEAKVRTLRDLLADSVAAGPDLNASGSELAAAHADLNALYVTLQQTDDRMTRSVLRRQAEVLEQQVSTLRLRAAAAVPSRSPNLEQGRSSSLDDDAAPTLAYQVVGADVIVFVATAAGITGRRLAGATQRVDELLADLAQQWHRFSFGTAFGERHQQLMLATTDRVLAGLYDVLIRPLGPLGELFAPDSAEAPALRIVPHRQLGSVPFQALFDGESYLIERFELSVSPTLRPGPELDPAELFTRSAVLVAAPDAAAPAVAAEVRAIDQLLSGRHDPAVANRLLVGEQATTPAVTERLPGAGLVHLACHGLYRSDSPLFSRVRLDDRWVTSAEILQWRLDRSLVVLSACESGRHGRAAEPIGLGWSFLAAGAAGVVVSQWMVHDDSANELMVEFYRGLIAGRGPASALRAAQLATAASRPHPYYWAPFTYLLSPGPLLDVPT